MLHQGADNAFPPVVRMNVSAVDVAVGIEFEGTTIAALGKEIRYLAIAFSCGGH